MDKLYFQNLTSCMYYLITLFYKTDCQYSSSNKKVKILLTIYALCNLKEKNNLKLIADNDILSVMIPENILCREIYRRASYKDNNQKIENEYNKNITIPYYYRQKTSQSILTKENNELLESIFLSFGAYDLETLSKLLKEIQTDIPFESTKTINLNLDINEFILYLNTNSIKFNNNEIFNFIRTYYYNLNDKGISIQSNIPINNNPKEKEEPLTLIVSQMLGFTNQKYELEKQFQNLLNTSNIESLNLILEKIEEVSKLEQKTLKKIKKRNNKKK